MKILIAILAAALLSGCANILYRTDGSENFGPYYCTKVVAAFVAAPFTEPKGQEGRIARAWCTLFLPVTVIDLPLDAVVDTLLFPYDFFAEDNNQRKETNQ